MGIVVSPIGLLVRRVFDACCLSDRSMGKGYCQNWEELNYFLSRKKQKKKSP